MPWRRLTYWVVLLTAGGLPGGVAKRAPAPQTKHSAKLPDGYEVIEGMLLTSPGKTLEEKLKDSLGERLAGIVSTCKLLGSGTRLFSNIAWNPARCPRKGRIRVFVPEKLRAKVKVCIDGKDVWSHAGDARDMLSDEIRVPEGKNCGYVVITVENPGFRDPVGGVSDILLLRPSRTSNAPRPPDWRTRYRWRRWHVLLGAEGIIVKDAKGADGKPRRTVRLVEKGKGRMPVLGRRTVIDTAGSRDVRIEIDARVKKTVYAGLAFKAPVVLEIRQDGTLLADRAGVIAADQEGRHWKSRNSGGPEGAPITFFPQKPPATRPGRR